jgi:hypothetical protein
VSELNRNNEKSGYSSDNPAMRTDPIIPGFNPIGDASRKTGGAAGQAFRLSGLIAASPSDVREAIAASAGQGTVEGELPSSRWLVVGDVSHVTLRPLGSFPTVRPDSSPARSRGDVPALEARDRRERAKAQFTERWSAHQTDHPPSPSRDDPRRLDPAADAQVSRACDRVRDIEQRVITPAMRDIESENPDRSLVGLDHRLKGPDRLKEKIADQLHGRPGLQPEQAVANIKDAVRFTFEYSEERYAAGVLADHAPMESRGFALVERRNFWGQEHYKGINSRWREPGTGQVFEVQFHARGSFEAKQLTHPAYERIRNPNTSDAEVADLYSLQRDVCVRIPVPPGAVDIEDYPGRKHDG